jgi:hypothetical protein
LHPLPSSSRRRARAVCIIDKVDAEWNFIVDGIRCAIWDYKGSAELGFWSFFGPRQIFVHLFGAEHVS